MSRLQILPILALLWFSGPASGWAQDNTARCSSEDLFFLGLGTGFNDGLGFRTQFQLRNLGGETVQTQLLLFQDSGEPWEADMVESWPGEAQGEVTSAAGVSEITIPGNSTLILALESRDPGRLGWSCVSPEPELETRVELQVGQFPDSSTGVFEHSIDRISQIEPTRAARRFILPIHYFAGGRVISTAFAVANVSAGRGDVTAVLAATGPEEHSERTVTLESGQLFADYWDHFWGVAHPTLFGQENWETAEIRADFPIAVAVQKTLQDLPISGVEVVARPSEAGSVAAALGEEVILAVGQKATFEDGLSVEFWNVAADSRCPTDVVCVWQGEAVIELRVEGASIGVITLQLSDYGDRNSVAVGDFRIELRGVDPAPISTQPIAIDDYRIRLLVDRTGNQ